MKIEPCLVHNIELTLATRPHCAQGTGSFQDKWIIESKNTHTRIGMCIDKRTYCVRAPSGTHTNVYFISFISCPSSVPCLHFVRSSHPFHRISGTPTHESATFLFWSRRLNEYPNDDRFMSIESLASVPVMDV